MKSRSLTLSVGEDSPFGPYVYEFPIIVAANPTKANPAFDDHISHTVAAIFTEFYEQSIQDDSHWYNS